MTATLTFAAGSGIGAQESFDIQIIDDSDCEGQEDIALLASSAVGQFAAGDNQCSLVIIDDGELYDRRKQTSIGQGLLFSKEGNKKALLEKLCPSKCLAKH